MSRYPIPLDYTWSLKISSFDVGENRLLRMSSQLKLQQEAGELQFTQGGLGFEELMRHGLAFVITRANSIIYRTPRLNEQVRLVTWHRSSKGAQFYRCYQFLGSDGELLIDSVSAFALIDPDTHKILRPSVFSQYAITGQPNRLNSCPDPERWNLPKNLTKAGSREVRWSDIDYNGHLNNAIYADIVFDAMPRDMREREITGFSIAYLHEALEGERISLKSGVVSGESGEEVWVAGDHERGRCFEACVRFKPD